MKEIVFATSNKHKIFEVQEKFNSDNVAVTVLPVKQPFNPDETGVTFLENSYIKAFEAAKIMNKIAFADDSGLCVEALDNRPGIYSARYAPAQQEKISKLLKELENFKTKEERKAYFACAISVVNPNGETLFSYLAKCHGYIGFEPKGQEGFGFDPIFYPENSDQSFAEIDISWKNSLSHRSLALTELIKYFDSLK